MKPFVNSGGYKQVTLNGKKKQIHRLVAETFIENLENKPTVDHIDRNPTNNNVSNLRWATYDEQRNNVEGSSKKTPIIAMKNGSTIQFDSQSECARALGLSQGNINNCLRGRQKTHKGYTFENVEGCK